MLIPYNYYIFLICIGITNLPNVLSIALYAYVVLIYTYMHCGVVLST